MILSQNDSKLSDQKTIAFKAPSLQVCETIIINAESQINI
jgi:hypothetical protein